MSKPCPICKGSGKNKVNHAGGHWSEGVEEGTCEPCGGAGTFAAYQALSDAHYRRQRIAALFALIPDRATIEDW